MIGIHGTILVAGLVMLVAGVVAVVMGQPFHVYLPLLHLGGLTSALMGALLPVVRRRYAEAEHRRIDAEEIRRET